jgi:hypothetical protein
MQAHIHYAHTHKHTHTHTHTYTHTYLGSAQTGCIDSLGSYVMTT